MDSGDLSLKADGKQTLPDLKLIYHAPCHLRAQGNGLPGLELLRRLDGVTVENADAGCCGISGSYGFKKEKYDIAQTVGSELFAKVRESGAQAAVSRVRHLPRADNARFRQIQPAPCHHSAAAARSPLGFWFTQQFLLNSCGRRLTACHMHVGFANTTENQEQAAALPHRQTSIFRALHPLPRRFAASPKDTP